MTNLKPEERAREWIDRKLEDAGWKVINRDEYAPGMTAVAVREAAMRGGLEADYLLLINGKAAAVLEAKREEISLSNPHLIAQAENYTKQVKPWYPTWVLPLPFVYLSNGKEIAFKDCLKPNAKYEIITKFPRPWDLVRRLQLGEFDGLPYLSPKGLRKCQYEAVNKSGSVLQRGQAPRSHGFGDRLRKDLYSMHDGIPDAVLHADEARALSRGPQQSWNGCRYRTQDLQVDRKRQAPLRNLLGRAADE